MIITTTLSVEGRTVSEYLGIVSAAQDQKQITDTVSDTDTGTETVRARSRAHARAHARYRYGMDTV